MKSLDIEGPGRKRSTFQAPRLKTRLEDTEGQAKRRLLRMLPSKLPCTTLTRPFRRAKADRSISTALPKEVTDDMKTKNQVKEGSQVIAAKASAPVKKSAFSKRGPKGEPKKELQKDINWMVENFENERVVMEDVDMRQLVVILNCRNTTIQVPKKVKSICVDSCEKVNVICQDVISAVELVNSDRCQMQAMGKVVAVAIDKCDGVNVWLSKESVGAEITASKSSEMNVNIPDPDGKEQDGDMIELPIPEQFVSRVVGKKLKTEVSGIYS